MGNIISSKDVMIPGINQSLYEIILDQSSDPIFCFAPDGTYLYINAAFSKAFGLMPSDIIGKRIWDVFPGAAGDMRFAAVKKALETQIEQSLEVKVPVADGIRHYLTTVTPIMDANGVSQVAICISKEITIRKNMEEALDESVKALYKKTICDGLTRLYNRQHVIDLLECEIVQYEQRQVPICLMFMDLDHYKRINDRFGHSIGDDVLIEFSTHLCTEFQSIGHIGRYGGEEFVIVLPNMEMTEALERAQKLMDHLAQQNYTSEKISLTVSIGLAQYQGEGVNGFLKRSDDLQYLAKANGRNRVEYES